LLKQTAQLFDLMKIETAAAYLCVYYRTLCKWIFHFSS